MPLSPGDQLVRVLAELPVTGEEACPYLPGRQARYRAFCADDVPASVYHELMNLRFRRSGDYFYQPVCHGCDQCVPIRVPVGAFVASRSQRRVVRRNQDVEVAVGVPVYSDEKFSLYRRYMREWHGKRDVDEHDFQRFLVESPVASVEFQYRDAGGRLLALGICDVSAASLSTVYFYFDPASAGRSLGTYGALVEIDWARRNAIPHYYLGYWVPGSATMDYKARFQPHELLREGEWIPARQR